MYSQNSSCPICHSDYDDALCVPRILGECGHSVCSTCLAVLLQQKKHSKCPLDMTRFDKSKQTVEDFPVNLGLKQVIEEKSAWQICEKHHERIRLLCMTDKQRICDDCVHDGEHKDHELISFKQIQSVLDERRQKLEAQFQEYNTCSVNVQNTVKETKSALLGSIQEQFLALRVLLDKKEAELRYQVNSFFALPERMTAKKFEATSKQAQETIEKFNQQKSVSKSENLFDLLKEDPVEIQMVDQRECEVFSQCFHENLKETTQCFNETIQDLGSKLSGVQLSLANLEKISNDFLKIQHQDNLSPEVLQLDNNLKCDFEGGNNGNIVNISVSEATENDSQQIQLVQRIMIENLKSKSHVRLVLNSGLVSSIDPLINLWRYFENIDNLELIGNNADFDDQILKSLFGIIFFSQEKRPFKTISLNLAKSRVKDSDMVFLFQSIQKSVEPSTLANFQLNISQTDITNRTILELATIAPILFGSLKTLLLDVNGTITDDQAFSKLFCPIPQLENLYLNLTNTQIKDEGLEAFALTTLAGAENLRSFVLSLSNTKVTDASCLKLSTNLPNLQELGISLNSTPITNSTIEHLAELLNKSSNTLTDLSLLLDNTNITDECMLRFEFKLPNLKEMLIHINSTRISGQGLAGILQTVLSEKRDFSSFSLGASKTSFPDNLLIAILGNLGNVPSLALNLSSTPLTDQSAEALFRSLVSRKSTLKSLQINLNNTKMSTEAIAIIEQLRKEIFAK